MISQLLHSQSLALHWFDVVRSSHSPGLQEVHLSHPKLSQKYLEPDYLVCTWRWHCSLIKYPQRWPHGQKDANAMNPFFSVCLSMAESASWNRSMVKVWDVAH